jgi:hypothetical protein
VVEGGGWRRLRRDVDLARGLLEKVRDMGKDSSAPPFTEVLFREKQRAERYNHYFSVVVLVPEALDALEVLRRSAGLLRASDMVGIVDSDGQYHPLAPGGTGPGRLAGLPASGHRQMVGVILPETDRPGAEIAARRLESVLVDDERVKIGIAIFPDDSTHVEDLVSIAAA